MTTLGEALVKINKLGVKYDFSFEDRAFLFGKIILLGEALNFIEDLGLHGEMLERYEKACKKTEELMLK